MRTRWLGALIVLTVSSQIASAAGAPSGPATPSAAAVRVHAPPRTFTVAAGGDILFEGRIGRLAASMAAPGVRYDSTPFFEPLRAILSWADLAICHMETPIDPPGGRAGWVGTGPTGTNLIVAPYEIAGDLRRVGFDRCSTASNHSYDQGLAGIRSTLDALDAAGVSHAGTARAAAEALPPAFDVNGVRVAHLSYARNSNTGWPRDQFSLARAVTADPVVADIAAERAAGAEVVIISLHVYVEMQYAPTPADRALVTEITARAHPDLIVIHGPHVIQPVERVNGTLVYWSVGNLLSAMGLPGRGKYSDPRTLDGLLATVRFTERPAGGFDTEPWTVLVCNELQRRIVHPALTDLADPATSTWLRTELQRCHDRSVTVVTDLR
jgi:poly-gamma-glutamate synthesis protein (capsule biosynthesis protein)